METIYLDEAMDYKNLDAEQLMVLGEMVRYFLMDYSYFVKDNEPQATNTIRRLGETAMSISVEDSKEEAQKFLEWLHKQ